MTLITRLADNAGVFRVRVPTALIGARVERTAFDQQVRLSFCALGPDEGYRLDAELVLETPFLFRDAAGEWHELDPGTGVSLAPVLGLFGQSVVTLDVRDRGVLVIDFEGGAGLWVGSDPQFESWHLNGHGVDPIVVGPGGEENWER
ncbi:DUF6188 family protein [Streptomyces sp. NPDC007148]|uniref:DUF6188 family protein n=1 Tax=Streptomyces sp. NPDC007148 TaxID=3364775 RepID=UPI0036BE522D